MRSQRKVVNEKEEIKKAQKALANKDVSPDYLEVYDCGLKGRGVRSKKEFKAGEYLLYYHGKMVYSCPENDNYLFEVTGRGKIKTYFIDATKEDASLGRLLNDSKMNPNTITKLITNPKDGHKIPCFFARTLINPGDELVYQYGGPDTYYPWRYEKLPIGVEAFKSITVNNLSSRSVSTLQKYPSANVASADASSQTSKATTISIVDNNNCCIKPVLHEEIIELEKEHAGLLVEEAGVEASKSITVPDNLSPRSASTPQKYVSSNVAKISPQNCPDASSQTNKATAKSMVDNNNCCLKPVLDEKIVELVIEHARLPVEEAGVEAFKSITVQDNLSSRSVSTPQKYVSTNVASADASSQISKATAISIVDNNNCYTKPVLDEEIVEFEIEHARLLVEEAGVEASKSITVPDNLSSRSASTPQKYVSANLASADNFPDYRKSVEASPQKNDQTIEKNQWFLSNQRRSDGYYNVVEKTFKQDESTIADSYLTNKDDFVPSHCEIIISEALEKSNLKFDILSTSDMTIRSQNTPGPIPVFESAASMGHSPSLTPRKFFVGRRAQHALEKDSNEAPVSESTECISIVVSSNLSSPRPSNFFNGQHSQQSLEMEDGIDGPIPVFESAASMGHSPSLTPRKFFVGRRAQHALEKDSNEVKWSETISYKRPLRLCPFCEVYQTRLKRHIIARHSDKNDVKKIFSDNNKKIQRSTMTLLKRKGIFLQFIETVKKNSKELYPRERRSRLMNNDLKICMNCKGSFKRKFFGSHVKSCKKLFNDDKIVLMAQHVDTYVNINKDVDKAFYDDMCHSIANDEVGSLAKEDNFILLMGERKYLDESKGNKKKQDCRKYAMQDMRALSRALLEYRKKIGAEVSMEEMLKNEGKGTFVIFKSVIKEIKSPAFQLTLGWLVRNAAATLEAKYASEYNQEEAGKVTAFLKALKFNWTSMFGSASFYNINRGYEQLRKPSQLPSQEVIQKFKKYIIQNLKDLTNENSYKIWDTKSFIFLRRLIISRLIVFNGRRSKEVARITIEEFKNIFNGTWETNIEQETELVEDTTVHKMCWQPGKGRKMISVFIPDDCIPGLNILISESVRELANVAAINSYVFPVINSSSPYKYADPTSDFLYIKIASGINPNDLTAIKMRHYCATKMKALNVPKESRCKHLGHEKDIHDNVYTCPETQEMLSDVGYALHQMDNDTNPIVIAKQTHSRGIDSSISSQTKNDCNPANQRHSVSLSQLSLSHGQSPKHTFAASISNVGSGNIRHPPSWTPRKFFIGRRAQHALEMEDCNEDSQSDANDSSGSLSPRQAPKCTNVTECISNVVSANLSSPRPYNFFNGQHSQQALEMEDGIDDSLSDADDSSGSLSSEQAPKCTNVTECISNVVSANLSSPRPYNFFNGQHSQQALEMEDGIDVIGKPPPSLGINNPVSHGQSHKYASENTIIYSIPEECYEVDYSEIPVEKSKECLQLQYEGNLKKIAENLQAMNTHSILECCTKFENSFLKIIEETVPCSQICQFDWSVILFDSQLDEVIEALYEKFKSAIKKKHSNVLTYIKKNLLIHFIQFYYEENREFTCNISFEDFLKDSKQVGSSKVGSSKVGSMFTKSDRVSWNAQDGNLIAAHFNKYVTDTTYLDAKGKLPSKKEIVDFLSENPHVQEALTPKTRAKVTKRKIFHLRQDLRRRVKIKLNEAYRD